MFLCFCFFYYLFYDWIKWPIVKVNDSQRHKIAHFLLWLLSIILFNDKLGLAFNIFASSVQPTTETSVAKVLMPPSLSYCAGDFQVYQGEGSSAVDKDFISFYTLSFPIIGISNSLSLSPIKLPSTCVYDIIKLSLKGEGICCRWWFLWIFNAHGFKELIFSFHPRISGWNCSNFHFL